jgi:uncharacterized protein YqjF (DUF2071 family)
MERPFPTPDPPAAPFLKAEWRHLAMLNYPVDPNALSGFVPRGTELDTWNGCTYMSVVGFLFLRTRVLGVPVPFHTRFEEVNLRFYVRRKSGDGWKRGVVFVKELVPRAAIAFVARVLYNEKYDAVPMEHEIVRAPHDEKRIERVSYSFRVGGKWHRLRLRTAGSFAPMVEGSEAQFIAEHYWGYSIQKDGSTSEYQVEHPPWAVAEAAEAVLDSDVESVYGPALGSFLKGSPRSAFLAEGSPITVFHGVRLSD